MLKFTLLLQTPLLLPLLPLQIHSVPSARQRAVQGGCLWQYVAVSLCHSFPPTSFFCFSGGSPWAAASSRNIHLLKCGVLPPWAAMWISAPVPGIPPPPPSLTFVFALPFPTFFFFFFNSFAFSVVFALS